LIYQKTQAGHAAFKARSIELSARQRSAFLLFDGKRSLSDVLKATAGLGIKAPDIEDLVMKGWLAAAFLSAPTALDTASPTEGAGSAPSAVAMPLDALTASQLYQRAYPIATRLTAQLGLRGFRLNLAVEAASGYDDLAALLPKITTAVGDSAAAEFKQALGL